MATENTHSMCVASAGGTAAGETTIGTITLPAGGPWIIHNVFGLLSRATATANEVNAGNIRIETASGDVTPQPAPARFPLSETSSFLGATADVPVCPLHNFPVRWEAAGKAVLNLIYNQSGTMTVAPQLVLGLMFGKSVPEPRPIIYSDLVRAAVTAAAKTTVGTITLAEKATRITGIYFNAMQDNVLTTAEELIGFGILESDDIDLTPFQIPLMHSYGAGLGALIMGNGVSHTKYIPLDIPVTGGARIQASIDLNTALTNAAEVSCFIAYE